jgi:hypothetical protein
VASLTRTIEVLPFHDLSEAQPLLADPLDEVGEPVVVDV